MTNCLELRDGWFGYDAHMHWGPWRVDQTKEMYKNDHITVLDCLATEFIEDENGFAPSFDNCCDPRLRHFLVGRLNDDTLSWWYNIGDQNYHTDPSIVVEKEEIIVKGYGFNTKADEEVHINIQTGQVSVVKLQN